jgi:hypothetical protein
MTATEQPSKKLDSNSSENECVYGKSGGPAAFSLTVDTTTNPGLSPVQVVANVANAEKTPAQKVSGVGEAAAFFTPGDGTSNMTAAKRSAGQVRIVVFVTSSVVPEQKFSDVEKLVLSRI